MPLPVGYAELSQKWDCDKRTIQRWVRAGKLPRPMTLPGRRAGWYLVDIKVCMDRWRNGLDEIAVRDPSKLQPEQLEDAISSAGAEIARRAGIDLPVGCCVSLNTPLTAEQQAAGDTA